MVVVVAMLAVGVVMTVLCMIMLYTAVFAVIVCGMSVRRTRRFMRVPGGVGAAFGVERCLDLDDARP